MSEHWLYTGGRSYLVTGDEGGEFDDIVAWMATEHGQPAPVVALSRQQVLTRIARTTLPTGFPDPDVVIGDPDRETGVTRGWLEQTVTSWEHTHLDTPAAEGDADTAAGRVLLTTRQAPRRRPGRRGGRRRRGCGRSRSPPMGASC